MLVTSFRRVTSRPCHAYLGISYSRYSTARNPPSTAESPRFEPIARTLPVPPRLRDNGRQDRASARVLPGSGSIRFGSGLFLRPPDPLRPTHHGGSETRAGNYPVESIRQTHPASALTRFPSARTAAAGTARCFPA